MVRGLFDLFRVVITDAFNSEITKSYEEDTWFAPAYFWGHLITECIPMIAVLLSVRYAVQEKTRALTLLKISSESFFSPLVSREHLSVQWTDFRRTLEQFIGKQSINLQDEQYTEI